MAHADTTLPPAAPGATDWGLAALQPRLQPLWPGLQLQVVAETASTNTALVERARQGDVAPCVLVAERQTQGRGRQGKVWQSAAGASLTFSLSVPLTAADWSGLSLAVGLALAEALEPGPGDDLDSPSASSAAAASPALAGAARRPRIALKWPNDLLLLGSDQLSHKLGGILIESLPVGPQRWAVIGIGLNIAAAPLQGLSLGYGCVQQLHPRMTAPAVLARVLPPLLAVLRAFERGGFAPLRSRFAARDALLGQAVTTTLPGLPEGVAEGVADNGALWVRAGGLRHAVSSGEVSVRATTPGHSAGHTTTPQQVIAC